MRFILVYLCILISTKSFCINNDSLENIQNRVKIKSLLSFGFSLKEFNSPKNLPDYRKDSFISSYIGLNHTTYIEGKNSALGLGIGIEGLTIDKNTFMAAPIFLSTKLKSNDFPVGLILRAGNYILDKNNSSLNKANFFDINLFFSPQTTIGSFGITYKKIIGDYKNDRSFSNDYLAFNVNLSID